jgi:hypothetical protein
MVHVALIGQSCVLFPKKDPRKNARLREFRKNRRPIRLLDRARPQGRRVGAGLALMIDRKSLSN